MKIQINFRIETNLKNALIKLEKLENTNVTKLENYKIQEKRMPFEATRYALFILLELGFLLLDCAFSVR